MKLKFWGREVFKAQQSKLNDQNMNKLIWAKVAVAKLVHSLSFIIRLSQTSPHALSAPTCLC